MHPQTDPLLLHCGQFPHPSIFPPLPCSISFSGAESHQLLCLPLPSTQPSAWTTAQLRACLRDRQVLPGGALRGESSPVLPACLAPSFATQARKAACSSQGGDPPSVVVGPLLQRQKGLVDAPWRSSLLIKEAAFHRKEAGVTLQRQTETNI